MASPRRFVDHRFIFVLRICVFNVLLMTPGRVNVHCMTCARVAIGPALVTSHCLHNFACQGIIAFYPPTDIQDKLGSYLKFPCSLPRFFGASVGPVRQQSMFAWFFQRVVSQRRSVSSPAAATAEDSFLKSSCPLELLSILKVCAHCVGTTAAAILGDELDHLLQTQIKVAHAPSPLRALMC